MLVRLAEEMVVRAVRGGHIATIAWVRVVHALFEVMFGNPARATPIVTEMVAVAREHGMKLWMAFGSFLEPWAIRMRVIGTRPLRQCATA